MRNDLSAVLIAACLVGALWSALLVLLDRRVTNALLVELCVAEALVVVQLLVAVVLLATGDRPDGTAVFVAYAVAAPLVLPAGTLWAVADRSRSSILVITVVCLAVAVMVVRMLQIWETVPA